MKVMIVTPLYSRDPQLAQLATGWVSEPLGSAYLGRVLQENGHETVVHDRRRVMVESEYRLRETDQQTLEFVRSEDPDVIGFYCSTPMVDDIRYLVNALEPEFGDRPFIVGGPHPTSVPRETLEQFPEVDYLFAGECERSIVEFAEGTEPTEISGVFTMEDGQMVGTPPSGRLDPEEIPKPDRSLLAMDFYLRRKPLPRYQGMKIAEIMTSRGCLFSCGFCASSEIFPHGVRFHPIDQVIDELYDLRQYDVDYVYFNDDSVLSNKDWLEELLAEIRDHGLHEEFGFFGQARVDQTEPDILEKMKKTGFERLEFGFESGSNRTLARMRKGAQRQDNLKAARVAGDAGFDVQGNIIIGYPDETREDIEQTIDFVDEIPYTSILINTLWVLPGTAADHEVNGRDGESEYSYPMHPFLTTENHSQLDDEEFKDLVEKAVFIAEDNVQFVRENFERLRTTARRVDSMFTPSDFEAIRQRLDDREAIENV